MMRSVVFFPFVVSVETFLQGGAGGDAVNCSRLRCNTVSGTETHSIPSSETRYRQEISSIPDKA